MSKGYFKMPELTSQLYTDDGWISTGDVALIEKNGSVKLIDRAKNIFKISQGEYVAPEKLENIYV
jgi:long-chain acyl-CoA synthetase